MNRGGMIEGVVNDIGVVTGGDLFFFLFFKALFKVVVVVIWTKYFEHPYTQVYN